MDGNEAQTDKGEGVYDEWRALMTETSDLQPFIKVDWEAVEDDIGHEVEPGLKQAIEHKGGAIGVDIDKWGYGDGSLTGPDNPFSGPVRDHGRIIHPDRGTLDSRYANLHNASGVIDAFKRLEGYDINTAATGTIIDIGNSKEFVDGVADLYDAARELDKHSNDWYEGPFFSFHPQIMSEGMGPDLLGSYCVHLRHPDESVIETINVDGLPIEHEKTEADPAGKYYTGIFRHERYYPKTEPRAIENQAEKIGLIDSNQGHHKLEQDLHENNIEYEKIGRISLSSTRNATVYQYEQDGETRYAVEWMKRISIDDYVMCSLIFNQKPDESTVRTARKIDNHRREEELKDSM